MTLSEANQVYLNHLLANNKLGAHKAYGLYFKKFTDFLKDKRLDEVTNDDIQQFMLSLGEYKKNYRATIGNALKGYLKYFYARGLSNISSVELQTQQYEEVYRDTLTQYELQKILTIFSRENYQDIRNKLIINMLYDTAMRVSELTSVTIQSLGSGQDCFAEIVSRKTNQRRFVMWSQETNKLLHVYLGYRLTQDIPTDALFIEMRDGLLPLSDRSVQRILKEACRLSRITKNVTPHILRHTKAHHMKERGADIEIIRQKLGHKNIQNTTKYLRLNFQEFYKIQSDFV